MHSQFKFQVQRRRKVLEVGGALMMVRHKYTHARGVWGCAPPLKIRCSEIASEAIFALKSGQFLTLNLSCASL